MCLQYNICLSSEIVRRVFGEDSQKSDISKIYIESMNKACYPINTQMNSNICNASIFTNSFTSNPNNRVRIQDENHKKQINTCLMKEDDGIYWYIYKFCVIICVKLNSSSLQVLYLCKRGELLMNQRKSLKELNLLDKFLFDEAMDDPENVKTMLDIILSQNTNLKHPPQTEKEQRTSIDNRQIRLDVYAIDEDDVIYEVEAQKENTHNLPKRSRLYQGIIDSKLLSPGVVDFNILNEVLIVLIMPFDLFGYGLYRYTFQMKCEEVPGLKLDDGATRIFLNTRGKHPELVSPELIELLKYMEHSTDEVSEACESKRIQEMHRRVCQIRASEKTEVKYMQSWEERIMIKQEGIAEGRIEGEKVLLKSLIEKKMAKKYSAEQISAMLEVDVSEVENIMKEIQNEKYL